MSNLKAPSNDINILLVGQISSGKSTFTNALANYLHYGHFDLALNSHQPIILSPSMYNITDRYGDQYLVTAGNVANPFITYTGLSKTQDVKAYSFKIWNGSVTVRIIDTPGIGDFRGIEEDNKNIDKVLSHVGQYYELHAVCFVLNPVSSKLPESFINCMNKIMYYLNPSIAKNFIFCFNNTRESFYSIGHSESFMQEAFKLVEENFPCVKIPFHNNVFYFENEPFIQLIANTNYIELDGRAKQLNNESWVISHDQSWKLINYIVGSRSNRPLTPYLVVGKQSVNDVRRIISILTQPMIDVAQSLIFNIAVLLAHQKKMMNMNLNVEEMKNLFNIPIIKINVKGVESPIIACASLNCLNLIQVYDLVIFNVKSVCLRPSDLNGTKKCIVGDSDLIKSKLFDTSTKKCINCNCTSCFHMYSYYVAEFCKKVVPFMQRIEGVSSKKQIIEEVRKMRQKIDERILVLKEELYVITTIAAKFSYFMKTTSILPNSDLFEDYINFLIAREDKLNIKSKSELSHQLRKMLEQYTQNFSLLEKNDIYNQHKHKTFEESSYLLENANVGINNLFNLKISGGNFKKLFNGQIKARENEFRRSIVYNSQITETKKWRQEIPTDSIFSNYSTSSSGYWGSWDNSPMPYIMPNSERIKYINSLKAISKIEYQDHISSQSILDKQTCPRDFSGFAADPYLFIRKEKKNQIMSMALNSKTNIFIQNSLAYLEKINELPMYTTKNFDLLSAHGGCPYNDLPLGVGFYPPPCYLLQLDLPLGIGQCMQTCNPKEDMKHLQDYL